MAGQRRERADAVANRERILRAARGLLDELGVEGLTMQAVASRAGVGKGTVFHRFQSRDGLTEALTDEYMRSFQDAFLAGPPPLGPGAPPRERLEAFFAGLVRMNVDNLALALAAEHINAEQLPAASVSLALHVTNLIEAIDPQLEARVLSGYLLSAVSPAVLSRMHVHAGIDVPTLQRSAVQLVRGVTGYPEPLVA